MPTQRPNILIVLCDQLSQQAVGAYGNGDVCTPNMDALAAGGVRFAKAYTPCPLCRPARPGIWMGLLPHQTGVVANLSGADQVPDGIPTMGELFAAAGYQTVHFGKTHDAGSLRGFHCEPQETLPVHPVGPWTVNQDTTHDRYTTVRCVEYLQRPPAGRPFLAVADLVNPHNICGYVGDHIGPHDNQPIPRDLPPLPDNFHVADLADRPLPVQYVCCSHRRQAQTTGWNETNFRHYLAAYYHYTERVDAEIGLILDALRSTPAGENTLIVFLADHGDGMTCHGMVTKQVSFYEETTRVPLIFAGPGIVGAARAADEPLVSLLDVLPTLCDYAGVEPPQGLRGRSLMPVLRGERDDLDREYLAGEWHTEFGKTVSPGRMIRTKRYKYTRYLEAGGEELYDLDGDPGETRTLIHDPAHAEALQAHRSLLERHLRETDDAFLDLDVQVEPKWRSHALGYQNHTPGICAIPW